MSSYLIHHKESIYLTPNHNNPITKPIVSEALKSAVDVIARKVKEGKKLRVEEIFILYLGSITDELRSLRTEINETNKRIDTLNETLSKKIDETNKRTDIIYDSLNKRIDEINHRINETNKRIDTIYGSLNRRINETNKRIDEMSKKIDAITVTFTEQYNKLMNEMNNRFEELNKRIDDINKILTELTKNPQHKSGIFKSAIQQ